MDELRQRILEMEWREAPAAVPANTRLDVVRIATYSPAVQAEITARVRIELMNLLGAPLRVCEPLTHCGRIVLTEFIPYDSIEPVLPVILGINRLWGWWEQRAFRRLSGLLEDWNSGYVRNVHAWARAGNACANKLITCVEAEPRLTAVEKYWYRRWLLLAIAEPDRKWK